MAKLPPDRDRPDTLEAQPETEQGLKAFGYLN